MVGEGQKLDIQQDTVSEGPLEQIPQKQWDRGMGGTPILLCFATSMFHIPRR